MDEKRTRNLLERTGSLLMAGEPVPPSLDRKLRRVTGWPLEWALVRAVSELKDLKGWTDPMRRSGWARPDARVQAERLVEGTRYLFRTNPSKETRMDVVYLEEVVRYLHLFDDVPKCDGPSCFKGKLYDSGWYGQHPDTQDGWPCPFCDGTGFLFDGAKGYNYNYSGW